MVNINDIDSPDSIPADIMGAIFDKQMELALKYSDIEKMGTLLDSTDTNIDTAEGQKWIKDFAWRTTEELCEADEAKPLSDDHYREELIDALHFLTELSIIAGYNGAFVNSLEPKYGKDTTSYDVIYELGLMCNCLKNKPWKQSQIMTDRKEFTVHFKSAWMALLQLLYQSGLYDIELYNVYFKKNAVNQFRQRSKY
jgi:hypothetical protein